MGLQLNYSTLDRCLHRLAFGAPALQLAAADLENKLYGGDFRAVRAARPIFITSLPRAGTTLLLEVLHRFPALAAHSYRDMPFVMAPLFWAKLSGAFRKRSDLAERAHGDGLQIGYDSPEAFEEVIWRAFWPEKYGRDGIALWQRDDGKDDARNFFAEHLRKIVALRGPAPGDDGRYLSKNNGNIARLDLIGEMFPDATVLVPFRQPLEHAASLLRQHRNFLDLHRDEPFARRYMADIGHYEFGSLHRPVAFPGLPALTEGRDPLTLDYWLAYWIAAFEHILERHGGREDVVLLSYEETCAGGRAALARLCERLGIDPGGALDSAAALVKAPPAPRADAPQADPALVKRAGAVHEALSAGA